MSAIRFIYFDLGNVLVKFSVQRLLFQVSALIDCPEEVVRAAVFGDRRYTALELGEISPLEYYQETCLHLPVVPDQEAFLQATNNIFWVNDEILPIVRHLAHEHFPRGILSNTGPNHWNYVTTTFDCICKLFPRHNIASYQCRCIKPFARIYELALQEARTEIPDLRPDEVLFIDDLPDNVQGAIDFGFRAVAYVDIPQLTETLNQNGLPLPEQIHGTDA